MRIQDVALEAKKYFKCVESRDSNTIWRTVDNPPENIIKLVKAAHEEYLPDDYKYRFIVEALEGLSCCRSIEDLEVTPDSEPQMLTGWLHSKINRLHYMTRALAESNPDDSLKLLKTAQSIEKKEVLDLVIRQLQSGLPPKS